MKKFLLLLIPVLLILSGATVQAYPIIEISSLPGSILIDDDMIGNSSGDGDGIVDPGETIELYIH